MFSSLIGQSDLKKALEAYAMLMTLQTERFPDDSAKQAAAQAEALKLIGNVRVAMREWER